MENQNSGFNLFHEHETIGVIVILAVMIMSFLVLRINAEPSGRERPAGTVKVSEMPAQSIPQQIQ